MVNPRNQKLLSKHYTKGTKDLFKSTTYLPCETAPPGTQEAVFCQVQKFPRIVVLPIGFGKLTTLQLNQCVENGNVNQPCGFGCCTEPPFTQNGNQIVLNEKASQSQPYDPNSPFPFVPPEQQKRCYNIAATLNQCDFNKRNFFPNSGRPESAFVGPFGPI